MHCRITLSVLSSQTVHASLCMHSINTENLNTYIPQTGILWSVLLSCHAQAKKAGVDSGMSCSVPITRTSADYESQPNEPQQRSEVATHRGRPQKPPITQFFLLKLYFKKQSVVNTRTHSSSKPQSDRQLSINRDTVRERRAILGQT